MESLRRCLPAFLLIALTSAFLLFSDWNQRAFTRASADRSQARKWRISLVQLNNVLDVEESEEGVLAGLKESGLVEGRDYEIHKQNAQGDMATVSALVDNAVSQGADLLITFSTPTLQAALQRAGSLPIVFTYVANGVIAGAGRSNSDHLPNVTGVDFTGPFGEMLALVRQLLPGARRIGTLFVPSEVNSVFYKDELLKYAGKAGLELVVLPASTSSEVPDAALALTSRGVDAICQIPGNLTASAFASISRAAKRAQIPIFAFQTSQARDGAAVVLGRDYVDAGRQTALMAARIIRGERPAAIPIESVTRTKLILNLPAAQAAGLRLPTGLISEAGQVIR